MPLIPKNTVFEMLVSAWPVPHLKPRWLKLCSGMLGIRGYGYLKHRQIGAYRLRLDPGDDNDRHYYFGTTGHANTHLAFRLLRPGDCVIDVGANVGHFSAVCAEVVGMNGHVHAVEANPFLYNRLQETVSEVPDGPIQAHHAAMWSSDCQMTFHVATNSGWSSLVENATFQKAESVSVQAVTLDEFVSRENIFHVRLLKLDIEGAETDALLGAQECLASQMIDCVFLEVEPHRLKAFGRTGSDIASLMDQYTYTPAAFIKGDEIQQITEATRVPGSFNGDYLYVRRLLYKTVIELLFGE